MLLVAPLQHYQPWLPMLLGLLLDFPWKVTPLPRLLKQPQSGVFHSHPEQVHPFAGLSVRLELIQRGLRERQFSQAVADRLCHTVTASTAGIYDCKWRVYEGWCRTEQISPLQASVQQLAEFFAFLFSTRKLASSTIKGYRSAISTVFRLQGGWNPGTDPILTSLLRAFDIELPKSPKIVPQWNLALVLQAFLEEPFEPMDCCAMKVLTWKTVFLVALASARRVSCHSSLTCLGLSGSVVTGQMCQSSSIQPLLPRIRGWNQILQW